MASGSRHRQHVLCDEPAQRLTVGRALRLIAVDMNAWPQRPQGEPAQEERRAMPRDPSSASGRAWLSRWFSEHTSHDEADTNTHLGFTDLMARSLDTMQAQIARVQLALDPPELVIRIPRDACEFYEFWRARELIEIGRVEAEKALDAAGY